MAGSPKKKARKLAQQQGLAPVPTTEGNGAITAIPWSDPVATAMRTAGMEATPDAVESMRQRIARGEVECPLNFLTRIYGTAQVPPAIRVMAATQLAKVVYAPAKAGTKQTQKSEFEILARPSRASAPAHPPARERANASADKSKT